MRGEIGHRERIRIGAQYLADEIMSAGTEQSAAPKIRQRESRSPVTPVLGAQQCEQSLVLADRKQLPIRERPPVGRSGARELHDLTQDRLGFIEAAAAVSRRKDAV